MTKVDEKNKLIWELYVENFKILKQIKPFKSKKKHHTTKKIIDVIDLHSMNVDLAFQKLEEFIINAYHAEIKKIIVITGRGCKLIDDEFVPQGILRFEVQRWLSYTTMGNFVKSFRYADKSDGGDGALYVFLKNKNS